MFIHQPSSFILLPSVKSVLSVFPLFLPHCGTNKYEQNNHTAFSIPFIFVLFVLFVFELISVPSVLSVFAYSIVSLIQSTKSPHIFYAESRECTFASSALHIRYIRSIRVRSPIPHCSFLISHFKITDFVSLLFRCPSVSPSAVSRPHSATTV